MEQRAGHFLSRRRFVSGLISIGGAVALAACSAPAAPTAVPAKPAAPAEKPAEKPAAAPAASGAPKPGAKDVTISYWNDYGGANGKVMDQLLERFTKETGIKVEQQRMNNQDLNAKIRVTNQSGENPDIVMLLTFAVHSIARDGILEELDEKMLAEKGFKAEDYAKTPWEGGLFQGKRYHLPLDVVQTVFYLNDKMMKAANNVGSDGKVKVPQNREELITMAKAMTKDDQFGFSFGPPGYNWGFQNLLWQNNANVFSADMKKSGLAEPAAIEVGEFWGQVFTQHKVSPPGGVDLLKAFNANKLGMLVHGSWNVSGIYEAKTEFTIAQTPVLFKANKIWAIGHEYTLPKQKNKDDARRDASWTHMRWMTDHGDVWTIEGGVLASSKKVQADPRIQADRVLKVFSDQAPNWQFSQPTPKWAEAETKNPPVLEAVYLGKTPAKEAFAKLAKDIDAIPD